MRISVDAEVNLVTYSLGSCIGVCVYDPDVGVGGLLHFMLPESAISPDRARQNPYMFADTGVPLLLRETCRQGGDKRRMVVKIAGGAQVMDAARYFNIGLRNYLAVRKTIWNQGLLIQGEDIGGNVNRTLRLDVETGRVYVRQAAREETEL